MADLSRREFMANTARSAALLSGATWTANADQPPLRKGNFVLLMSDEHNPKISSIHAHPRVQTPNLDRLAARGTVFENTYCPSPLCMPCRSAFMSGQRVHQIQCYNNCNVIPFEYPSYGQSLGAQGIHTVYIGKADVYRPTRDLGFSEVIGSGDRTPPGDTNISRKPLAIRTDGAGRAGGYGPKENNPFADDDQLVNLALDWLAKRPAELDKPWVLVLNIGRPHFPNYVTQALWDQYAGGDDLPAYGREAVSANHPYAQDLRAHFQTEQFSEADIRGLRRGYLGCVTYVDQQVGRVMDAIDRAGLADSTTFAYTSDHGDMLGKFGLWWKCSLYEDSARVPLLVAGPGFAPKTRVRTPVDLHDLRATLFRSTGSTQPAEWVGAPLTSIAANDPDRPVFAEYHGHGTRASGYLLRKGDWKLLYYPEAPHQLFNLAEDPEELNNLAEKHPEKRRELEKDLRAVCDPEAENQRTEAFIQRQLAAIKAIPV